MWTEAPGQRGSRLDFRRVNVYQNGKGGSGAANTFPALGHPPVIYVKLQVSGPGMDSCSAGA